MLVGPYQLHSHRTIVAPNASRVGLYYVYFGICFLPATWSLTLPRLHSSGQARITSFASQGNAQTFDFQVNSPSKQRRSTRNFLRLQAGDISYIPPSFGEQNVSMMTFCSFGNYKSHHDRPLRRKYWYHHIDIHRDLQIGWVMPRGAYCSAC